VPVSCSASADETSRFVKGGITHLVEHLTMRALDRTTLDCNASVDVLVTEFVAAGRPERVAGFLRRVCEILADLPAEGLRIEVDVLRIEDSRVTQPGTASRPYSPTCPKARRRRPPGRCGRRDEPVGHTSRPQSRNVTSPLASEAV